MAGWTERQKLALAVAALGLLSVLIYAPTASFDFISYDDRIILLAHPELYDAASPLDIVLDHFPREEPLVVRDLSWWLDARRDGFDDPTSYHRGNIVWNVIAVMLFAGWLFAIRGRWTRAFFPALLFAVIPIHVEPVGWIMGRKDLLSAALSFAILIAHARYLHAEPGTRARRLAWAATLTLYPLAVLAKFNALLLPLGLALQHLLFPFLTGERGPRAPMPWARLKGAAASLTPHAVLAAGLYWFYSWNLTTMQVIGHRGPPLTSAQHLGTLAAFLPWVLAQYTRNLLSASEHSIQYPWPHTDIPMSTADLVGAAGIVTAALLLLALLYLRRRDLLFFYLASFALMIPYANLVYIGIWVADRYVYLVSGLVITAVVWAGHDLIARSRARPAVGYVTGGAFLALLFVWLVSTLDRVPVFRDDFALFGYEVELERPSTMAYSSLALAQLRELRDTPPDEQAARLPDVEATIADGIAHYEAQPWRRNPDYLVGDHLHYAELLRYSTMTGAMRGMSYEEQEARLLRAHTAAPHADTAQALAQVLHRAAERSEGAERERRARRSLRYFLEYALAELAMPNVTAGRAEALRAELHAYYDAFEALDPEVEAVEEQLR